MADNVKERLGEVVEKAKGVVRSDPPVATDVEGRVAVVREALQAFGDGDFDGFLGSMDEDVSWEGPEGGNFPGGGSLNGRDEIDERFLGDMRRSYDSFGFAPETYLEAEDRDWVVVIGEFQGEGVKGGTPLAEPAVQLWEFERGKVAAIRIFADSAVFPAVVAEEEEQEEDEQEQEEKAQEDDADDSGDESERDE